MADSLRKAFAIAGIEAPEPEPGPPEGNPVIEFEAALPDPNLRCGVDGGTDSPTGQLSWRQLFGIRDFGVSRHAAERYRERFGNRRDSLDAARDQLRARLDNDGSVTYSRERPAWLVIVPRVGGQEADNSAGFLIVDDEIALPIRRGTSRSHPYYVVTCIARI